jgi:hypothetical protein
MVAVLGPNEALPYYIHTYNALSFNRRFGGIYYLLSQGRSSQAGFLLVLFFDPEDGDMFLRKVIRYLRIDISLCSGFTCHDIKDMEKSKNEHKILVPKPDGKKPF